jgi:rhamnosyltransferase
MNPARIAASRGRKDVLAVVVTYNPGEELAKHLAALREQMEDVVVVDNGSANIAAVQSAAVLAGCRLVVNGGNRGIAAALNQGRALALESGAEWLATFDQDSLLPPGAIDGMLERLATHPRRDEVGILSPAHKDRGTLEDYHHRLDIIAETEDWRLLRTTITSGSLIRRAALANVGPFDERLFIDSVDHDFCLRARRRGWLVAETRRVVMAHSIGAATQHRFLGLRFVCTHHSPLRRYYITRNTLEVASRNALFDPVWSCKTFRQVVWSAAATIVGEGQRPAKTAAILRGVLDFGLRRFGPRR